MTVDHRPYPACCPTLLIFPLYNLDFGKHRRNELTLLIPGCVDHIKLLPFSFCLFKLILALIFHPSKQTLTQLQRGALQTLPDGSRVGGSRRFHLRGDTWAGTPRPVCFCSE